MGTICVLLYLGLLLLAVRKSARAVLLQARRQFQDNEALMDGSEAPDYAACVGQCAVRSLLGSLLPSLLALAFPMAAGVLMGPQGLMGFSGAVLILSVTLALFLSLSGGVLGGARRYVESGRKGGRGSECHRAALAAEHVLAPLSQMAGPALLALAQSTASLSLLSSALFAAFNLPALLG